MADAAANDPPQRSQMEWKPVPDPTAATNIAVTVATDQLRREIQALDDNIDVRIVSRSLLSDTRIEALKELTNTRLSAIELASKTFEENLNRIPTALDLAISHLKELHEAKFEGVAEAVTALEKAFTGQLVERDVRYSLVSADAKTAVADALAAQKEAVHQQDSWTTKQIDQQRINTDAVTAGILTQLSDIKSRVDKQESQQLYSVNAAAAKNTNIGQIVSYVIAAAAVIAIALDHLPTVAGK